MTIRPFTPAELIDLLYLLDPEDRKQFLAGLGLTAEALIYIFTTMPVSEQDQFNFIWFKEVAHSYFPVLYRWAVEAARENPEADNTELERRVNDKAREFNEYHQKKWEELAETRFKEDREVGTRNDERDDRIVYLHDREGLSFNQITRRLLKERPTEWCDGPNTPLPRDTVRKAYRRRKSR
jgi:hypothetical protein